MASVSILQDGEHSLVRGVDPSPLPGLPISCRLRSLIDRRVRTRVVAKIDLPRPRDFLFRI